MAFQEFTPIEYLMIDVATNFGLDKENWDVRLDWFLQHEDQLENLMSKADEPALFFAGVKAYRAAVAGKEISYPISLDATASGAQILAILTGCEKSARLCNVIDTGRREDFYTNIHHGIQGRVGEGVQVTRQQAKSSTMPWFYGSNKEPKDVFEPLGLLDIFNQTLEEDSPGIARLREVLLAMWQPDALINEWVMPDNFHVKVKVMDKVTEGFSFLGKDHKVTFKVNQPMEEGKSIAANTVHSIDGMIVREMYRRCTFDTQQVIDATILCEHAMKVTHPVEILDGTENCRMVKLLTQRFEETGFLSARIIDHIDAHSIHLAPLQALWELLQSMPEKSFPILSVHDCFRCHPNYGNDLRRQYNQILFELSKSEILADMATQIIGEPTTAPKFADISDQILEANYSLS